MFDKFREECGLMGVWNNPEAANIAYLGLFAQQHRGQEGAGVVTLDRASTRGAARFSVHKGLGLVSEVFGEFDFSTLPGECAIGHVRYTTAGGNRLANVQPFFAEVAGGSIAIAHNGNLTNADQLRQDLIDKGAIFSASSDTEVILHLIARAPREQPIVERLISALREVRGAYSLVVLWRDRLFAVRDPHGLRPLALATLDGGHIVASETCAFNLVGATFQRDVAPGEIVEISGNAEVKSYFPFGHTEARPCIFEYVYFARPDSDVYGRNVYAVRKRLGEELAREQPVNADLVIPVPDSGVTAAIGFSQVSKIPLELGLIRNHYVGRTFIEPKQAIRDFGVKIKLNANAALLRGKSVIVVDDSLVRGTTSRKLVAMLRGAGAREVHLRISSPPTTDPCYYGIDTPEKGQLIASHMSVEQIKEYIGVDSLAYLSRDGMYRAVEGSSVEGSEVNSTVIGDNKTPSASAKIPATFCDACFTGNYPISIGGHRDRQTKLL